jgi:GT2 family glycosyltransferase
MSPRFATIICTMNRPDDLVRALAALAACDPPPVKVVVSDDSPEADRRSEAACAGGHGVLYRRGPRRGLGANRNAALTAIGDADWVHFIDDDVIVPTDFYRVATDTCRRAAGLTLISGGEVRHGPGDAAVTVVPPRASFWPHLLPPGRDGGNCVVINAALFPRGLFERAAFDEGLRYGCEEVDMSREAEHLGYRLLYEPALCVDHYPSPTNRDGYRAVEFTSAVYAGLKHQLFRRRRPLAAAAFVAVAIPRMYLNHVRQDGLLVVPGLVRQTAIAFGFLMRCRPGGRAVL